MSISQQSSSSSSVYPTQPAVLAENHHYMYWSPPQDTINRLVLWTGSNHWDVALMPPFVRDSVVKNAHDLLHTCVKYHQTSWVNNPALASSGENGFDGIYCKACLCSFNVLRNDHTQLVGCAKVVYETGRV